MSLPTAHEFVAADVRAMLRIPSPADDKYSRGVVGFVTGSVQYPGAAVLGTDAAYRTGVGLVRFVGPDSVANLVLQRRPEVVPGNGRVHAWVLGSGVSAVDVTHETRDAFGSALEAGVPVVLDAGALDLVSKTNNSAHVVITPHITELSRLMIHVTGRASDWSAQMIERDPLRSAVRVADELGVTVMLKGHTTFVASPAHGDVRSVFQVTSPTTWLATAGTGDVLAGMLGSILATARPSTQADNARCAATSVYLHGCAAALASAGGPIAALDVCDAIPRAIREVLCA